MEYKFNFYFQLQSNTDSVQPFCVLILFLHFYKENDRKMPLEKNAYLRYQVLDRCFSNVGKQYFMVDLIEECFKELHVMDPSILSISRRQILYDIKFMESKEGWSIPLIKPRIDRKAYYQYDNASFSILNQPPSKIELEQIENAKLVITRLASLDEFEWMHELVAQLEELFTDSERKVIDFGRNQYLEGLSNLSKLYYAILNKQVLEITYKPFHREEPLVTLFHPLYLKQYNNRWFLIGHIDSYESLTNYPIDRITKIEEVGGKFVNLEIDFKEYFDDVIGVTRNLNDEPVEIKLRFSLNRAPYILTKPLHGSQKTKQDENGLTVTIEVIPNRELIAHILSYGDDVTVISPESLREEVATKLKNSLKNY